MTDEVPTMEPAKAPTEKQMSYLVDLATKLDVPFVLPATGAQCSAQIQGLLRLQKARNKATEEPPAEEKPKPRTRARAKT